MHSPKDYTKMLYVSLKVKFKYSGVAANFYFLNKRTVAKSCFVNLIFVIFG